MNGHVSINTFIFSNIKGLMSRIVLNLTTMIAEHNVTFLLYCRI